MLILTKVYYTELLKNIPLKFAIWLAPLVDVDCMDIG